MPEFSEEAVMQAMAESCGLNTERMSLNQHLRDDHEIDEEARLDLRTWLEEEFGIDISVPAMEQCLTVEDVVELVRQCVDQD